MGAEQERLEQTSPSPSAIRLRAVVLGLALALGICLLTPLNNAYHKGTPLGGGHFPLAPFFILAWLTLLVALAGRIFRGRPWLTGRELLLTWVLMVVVSGIAYTGLVRTFFINLTAPYHFASAGNGWEEVLQPLLPRAMYPQSPAAVDDLYNGLEGGRELGWFQVLARIPWHVWLRPLLVWTSFVFLCYFILVCLVNLFSRQWIHNERMNFPLLQVPLVLAEAMDQRSLGRFLASPFLLVGLLVPVVLHLLNGLSFYYPSVPQVPTLILAGTYFPKYGLFSAFYKLKIYIYPAFIGFAFLASRQISFSFWLFFVLGGLFIGLLSLLGYDIPAAALGVTFGPNLSRPEETQMIGAYVVFFLFIVWLARYHLWRTTGRAFGLLPPGEERERVEWFSAPVSLWGSVLGLLALAIWCRLFGLPLLPAFLLVGAFFLVMLVASRVICQGGLAYFTLTIAPMDGLLAFFGSGFFSRVGLLVAAVTQKMLFLDLRESLMPSLFHAGKVSYEVRGRRLVFIGLAVALAAGVIVSFLAMLALCYRYGIRELELDWATRTTVSMLDNVKVLVETPADPGRWVRLFALVGAAIMLALVVCYHRLHWWPVHPIGYLTAYSSSMRILWFSFFLGWLANSLCIRYGGVALFKKLRLFFIGLIIGDFLMGGLWAVVGLLSDASYLVLPD